MKWLILGILTLTGLGITAASNILPGDPETTPAAPLRTPEARYESKLPNLGVAPELENEIWLNTDEPLLLENLRGQVVLLEMWTFGCYNCVNTLPAMRAWYDNYADEGLVVIGNHYPEFDYEANLNNLKDALVRLDIDYPVAQDNDRETWSAYKNRYWPTIYLIDKWGNIRYKHIGEGRYTETENAIKDLLAETYP